MAIETQRLMQQLTDAAGDPSPRETRIAVVIPIYRERDHIMAVLEAIPKTIAHVICIDDACPDRTGQLIKDNSNDPRIEVLFNDHNCGVGGATKRGFRAALDLGADIVVKLDGDGQMDPSLISGLVSPIVAGHADYTKGNRFYSLENIAEMPRHRIVGNVAISFVSKFSSGYWQVFDPANGFVAIHSAVLRLLPLDKLSDDFFFESDMLFRLNSLRAVVVDVPMHARYGEEESHLSIVKSLPSFAANHVGNFLKRIFYSYFLRNFSVASMQWIIGPLLLAFGLCFGLYHWLGIDGTGVAATAGTVMLAALPIIIGMQFLLAAIDVDVASVPSIPLHRLLSRRLLDAHINVQKEV